MRRAGAARDKCSPLALPPLKPSPLCPLSPPPQRTALEAAHAVRASADAAYLERDPADRPPPSHFMAAHAAAAAAGLDAALTGAGCGRPDATAAEVAAAVAATLGGGTASHVLVADALLARDGLRAAVARHEEAARREG